MRALRFFVITDTHFFQHSLGCWGEEYERFMDFEQKCFAETEAINRAVFRYLEQSREADIVLIAGDLSFNGEKESHLAFRELLRGLRASGKKIYVVTAGHDCTEHPFAFDETGRKEPAGTSFDELYELYREFGYDDAIAFDREHLSYVAQLADGVRLLVLCNDSAHGHGLAYSAEQLAWIARQAKQARADGQRMIAMEHYPVLAGQPVLQLIPDARQRNAAGLIETLADNGVHLIFTGHMHNQSINVAVTQKGNPFYDVCTGSVIGCPAFMRLVTLREDGRAEIKSIPVPAFEWDTGDKDCEQYLRAQFERMIRTILTGMRDDPQRVLRKFGAGDKKALEKPVRLIGKALNGWTVGRVALLFGVRADPAVRDMNFAELAVDIVRSIFEGDQPYVAGTPEGDTLLRVLNRLRPLLRQLSKKVKGAQGEAVDLYDMLKNSLGNYDISDYNASIVF